MNRLILQVFCALFSGLIEGFSISNPLFPMGSPLLGLISLFPLYIAIYNVKSYKQSFWLMGLQVLTVHLISSFWLAFFRGFGVFTLGASAFGTALEGALFGIIMHVYPHKIKLYDLAENNSKDFYSIFKRIFWFCAIFTLWEFEKSTGALGYPWGTLSSASYNFKIINQIADITGVLGISFVYTLCSAILGELYFYLKNKHLLQKKNSVKSNLFQASKLIAAVYVICLVYGLFQYFIPRTPVKYINTVVVQHNADSWGNEESINIKTAMALTEREIENLDNEYNKDADLVLWSEGMLSRIYPDRRNYYDSHPDPESLTAFIKRMGVPFIIGGTTRPSESHYANSAIFYDKNGKYSGYYSKMHLVPFAELIPYQDSPFMKYLMKEVVKMYSSLVQGYQFVKFKVPLTDKQYEKTSLDYNRELFATIELSKNGTSSSTTTEKYISNNQENENNFVNFTVPICFEDAFPSICRTLYNSGSEVFMNITNDSWSKTEQAELQHFIAASYRTIEFRTTMVRCCNAGYSCVIDPRGKILEDLPLFQEGAFGYSVPVYKHKATIYAKYGDWFPFLLLIIVFVYIFISILDANNLNLLKVAYSYFEEKKHKKNFEEKLTSEKIELLSQQINELQAQISVMLSNPEVTSGSNKKPKNGSAAKKVQSTSKAKSTDSKKSEKTVAEKKTAVSKNASPKDKNSTAKKTTRNTVKKSSTNEKTNKSSTLTSKKEVKTTAKKTVKAEVKKADTKKADTKKADTKKADTKKAESKTSARKTKSKSSRKTETAKTTRSKKA